MTIGESKSAECRMNVFYQFYYNQREAIAHFDIRYSILFRRWRILRFAILCILWHLNHVFSMIRFFGRASAT